MTFTILDASEFTDGNRLHAAQLDVLVANINATAAFILQNKQGGLVQGTGSAGTPLVSIDYPTSMTLPILTKDPDNANRLTWREATDLNLGGGSGGSITQATLYPILLQALRAGTGIGITEDATNNRLTISSSVRSTNNTYLSTSIPIDSLGSNGDNFIKVDSATDFRIYQKSAGTWGQPTLTPLTAAQIQQMITDAAGTGPQGPPGPKGDKGDKGDQGDPGDINYDTTVLPVGKSSDQTAGNRNSTSRGDHIHGLPIRGPLEFDGSDRLGIRANGITLGLLARSAIIETIHVFRNAITGDKIAPNSINNGHMLDNAINTAEVANDAITEPKLAPAVRTKLNQRGSELTTAQLVDLLQFDVVPGVVVGYTTTGQPADWLTDWRVWVSGGDTVGDVWFDMQIEGLPTNATPTPGGSQSRHRHKLSATNIYNFTFENTSRSNLITGRTSRRQGRDIEIDLRFYDAESGGNTVDVKTIAVDWLAAPTSTATPGTPPRLVTPSGTTYALTDAENELNVELTVGTGADIRRFTTDIKRAALTSALQDFIVNTRQPAALTTDNDNTINGFQASISGNNVTIQTGSYLGTIGRVYASVSGARGEAGPQGVQGPTGPQGPQGPGITGTGVTEFRFLTQAAYDAITTKIATTLYIVPE